MEIGRVVCLLQIIETFLIIHVELSQSGRFGGGSPRRLPAETDPADWDTDGGTPLAGYLPGGIGSPFGTNPWFRGGFEENGTNPTENAEWDVYKWAFLYCREDEENDETCGSLCEHVTPTIMWYTGIIEETV